MSDAITRDEGFFNAADGTRLFFRSVEPQTPKLHLVFIHGYSDHSGRYLHVFEALAKEGIATHAFDYRGHGRAEGRRGHCARFTDFLGDLATQISRVRSRIGQDTPLFLVAHSHGGLIALRWLIEQPQGILGAVITCPFMALGFDPPAIKVLAAKVIGQLIPTLPFGNELVAENLTHDEAFQQETREDPLYGHTTTPRWFTQVQAVQGEVQRRASEIVTPILMMQAGGDVIVSPAASKKVFDALSVPDKSWKEYPGMHHELLRETVRDEVMAETSSWLHAHLGR